jgi:Tfp pilus assembly protein PilF
MDLLPPIPVAPGRRESSIQELPPTLENVRQYADEGAWGKASQCCEELLAKDSLQANVHFYHALVLAQMNQHREAEASLRRAIYLDRRSVLAHYYLGLFLQSRGDPSQAAKSFENTLKLLACRSGTDSFPDADGITAAELKKLAAMHIESLQEQA